MWSLLTKMVEYRMDLVAVLSERTAGNKTAWELCISQDTSSKTLLALWAGGSDFKYYARGAGLHKKVKDLDRQFEDLYRRVWAFWVEKHFAEYKPNGLIRNAKCFTELKKRLPSFSEYAFLNESAKWPSFGKEEVLEKRLSASGREKGSQPQQHRTCICDQ